MQFKGRDEYGFVEHTRGGTVVAHSVLGKICSLSRSTKPMVPSLTETGARLFITRFLKSFITMGSLTLLEEGGVVISFGNLGFAEAYIDGDISFVDKNVLENFFECLNDGTPEVNDATFSILAAIAKTAEKKIPRKSAASMLSRKKPVQAFGSLIL
ncbi:hypothetical protein GIB67_002705 [Kingdonia uniflora]|uniref:Uncharacterized protein n=1 Tax=Kingdonia uniflora TaxID=39325 RepID=A0A7J7LJJ1_9MAGN|nr:hypothetical protein GIB67_002705 [Kingdonia uniflora]